MGAPLDSVDAGKSNVAPCIKSPEPESYESGKGALNSTLTLSEVAPPKPTAAARQISFDLPADKGSLDKTPEPKENNVLEKTFTPVRPKVDRHARQLQRQAELLEKDREIAEKKGILD